MFGRSSSHAAMEVTGAFAHLFAHLPINRAHAAVVGMRQPHAAVRRGMGPLPWLASLTPPSSLLLGADRKRPALR